MANGFYAPTSVLGSYVSNKRDENGSLIYESAANKIGINEQAALQGISRDYSQTINNAYMSYLTNKQGILGSSMGQGYKEAYLQNQQDQLINDIANANMNAANYRQQITASADEARENVQQAFNTEVANFDRVIDSLSGYFDYLKTVYSTDDKLGDLYYLSAAQRDPNTKVDDMYDILFAAQPQARGGQTYLNWMGSNYNNYGGNDWWQWFNTGGYKEARNKLAPDSWSYSTEGQDANPGYNWFDNFENATSSSPLATLNSISHYANYKTGEILTDSDGHHWEVIDNYKSHKTGWSHGIEKNSTTKPDGAIMKGTDGTYWLNAGGDGWVQVKPTNTSYSDGYKSYVSDYYSKDTAAEYNKLKSMFYNYKGPTDLNWNLQNGLNTKAETNESLIRSLNEAAGGGLIPSETIVQAPDGTYYIYMTHLLKEGQQNYYGWYKLKK